MRPFELALLATQFLEPYRFKDYGPMGLQVHHDEEIRGIAAAVSVTEDIIHRAAYANCNVLVVHHGLFWNTEPRTLDKRQKGRIAALDEHKMSILAYHLALDAHPVIGNNVLACEAMGARNLRRFGEVGWGGDVDPSQSGLIYQKITQAYPGAGKIHYFDYGPWPIRRVCAITGGGGNFIHEAEKEGYDLILTGEAEEPSKALARELGIHFVAAGHYATEKSGVDKLAEYFAAYADVPYQFILDDNPV